MSLNTALALTALGLSFLTPRSGTCLSGPASRRWWLSQWAALVAATIGYDLVVVPNIIQMSKLLDGWAASEATSSSILAAWDNGLGNAPAEAIKVTVLQMTFTVMSHLPPSLATPLKTSSCASSLLTPSLPSSSASDCY
jgi:hypothetical protein